MELVFFTKSLQGMDVETMGREVKALSFEGLDLAVRPGYCVNPDNVAKALLPALRVWADMGLSVPMVTTPGDFTDPAAPIAETLIAACANARIGEIKLGYWRYTEPGYWRRVDEIRAALDGFQRLAEKHGVRVAVHTHSGDFYSVNAAATMGLVRGFDPRFVGVYLDPAHLALNGEPPAMAIDMVRDYLCLVAAKNTAYSRTEQEGRVRWTRRVVPLREGLADWEQTLAALDQAGYGGPLSFHSEYADVSLDELRALTREDMAYIRGLMGNR